MKKKKLPLTHFEALRSGVALPVALAAPQLHELHVQLIQDASLHRVHRVGELWVERPGGHR